jgi:hypothetical protein
VIVGTLLSNNVHLQLFSESDTRSSTPWTGACGNIPNAVTLDPAILDTLNAGLCMSGYPASMATPGALLDSSGRLVSKPFTTADVPANIEGILRKKEP